GQLGERCAAALGWPSRAVDSFRRSRWDRISGRAAVARVFVTIEYPYWPRYRLRIRAEFPRYRGICRDSGWPGGCGWCALVAGADSRWRCRLDCRRDWRRGYTWAVN